MPNKKITELPVSTTPDPDDLFAVVVDGVTSGVAISDVLALGSSGYATVTTDDFVQPAVDAEVTVDVQATVALAATQTVYVEGGGYYLVDAVLGDTSVSLTNLGYDGNAAPSSVISAGAAVSGSGPRGVEGPAGTLANLSVRCVIVGDHALTGAAGTQDGVVVDNGDRVIAPFLTDETLRGVYVVNTGGAWTRAADLDSSDDLNLRQFFLVEEGTLYRSKFFYCTTAGTLTLDTSELTWAFDLKGPTDANTEGDFASTDANDDLSYGPITIVAGGTSNPFRRSKSLIFGSAVASSKSSFNSATDASGHTRINRGDEACITDYPYCAHASTTTATATGTGGTPNVVLNAAGDFAERDGVVVFGAGTDYAFPASLPAPTLAVNGTPGATTRTYKICAMTEDLALSLAGAATAATAVPDTFTTAVDFNPSEGYDSRVTFASGTNIADLSDVGPFIDDVELQEEHLGLLYGQTDPAENGHYQVALSDTGVYSLVRYAPLDSAPLGNLTFIYNGTVNMGKRFRCTTTAAVVDTDPQVFEEVYVRIRPPVTDVTAATTANIALTGSQTIDGVTLTNGVSTVLVKNQTAPAENGVYLYNSGGAWTRVTAFDNAAEFVLGTCFRVIKGTVNERAFYMLTTVPTVLGTDPVAFTAKAITHWVIYGLTNAGAYSFIGAMLANPLKDTTHVYPDTYFDDYGGFTLPTRPHWIPSTPPATSTRGFLRARISSIAGTSVTLDQNLGASVTAQRFDHDNYQALVDALAAHQKVSIPEGTYVIYGNLQINSFHVVRGAGRESTFLQFAPSFGLRVGPSGNAAGTHIGDLQLSTDVRAIPAGTLYVSQDSRKFHGAALFTQVRSHYERIRINSFRGSAFVLVARDLEGTNANVSSWQDCYSANNWGHNYAAQGSEANSLSWLRCSGSTSQGAGFYDSGFLGNGMLGCHCSANLGPPYWTEDATNPSFWMNVYSESGQPRSIVGQNVTVRGGSHGAGFLNSGVGDLGQGTYRNSGEARFGWPQMSLRTGSGSTASGGADLIRKLTSVAGTANGGFDWSLIRRNGSYATGYNDSMRLTFDSTFIGTALEIIGRYKYGTGKINFTGGYFLEESPGAGNTKRKRVHAVSGTTFINGAYRVGDLIYDVSSVGTVPFRYVIAAFGAGTARANSTAYEVGNCITSGGNAFVCTVKGVSAGSPPAFDTDVGDTTVDGTCTFECIGTASPVEGTHWVAPGSKIQVTDAARNIGALGAGASTSYTVTVTGAKLGVHKAYAYPKASLGADGDHITWSARVLSDDNVRITVVADGTGGTPSTVDWAVGVERN